MDRNEIDITSLVEKYENIRALGKTVYFDADEFVLLAEYYIAGGDQEEAGQLVEEGLQMHPGSPDLILFKARLHIFSTEYEEALACMRLIADNGDIEFSLIKI